MLPVLMFMDAHAQTYKYSKIHIYCTEITAIQQAVLT